MVALLGPILAQLVSLSAADRTEARELSGTGTGTGAYAEFATRPLVALDSQWQHSRLNLSYLPSLTLTTLGQGKQLLLVYQTVAITGSYRLGRTLLSATQAVGYGQQSFQQLALAGGGPTTMTPTPGAATGNGPAPPTTGTVLGGPPTTGASGTGAQSQMVALNKAIYFESLSTTVSATHAESANVSYGAEASYTLSGAVRDRDRVNYPLIHGPRGSAFTRYGWGPTDSVTSTVSLQYSQAMQFTVDSEGMIQRSETPIWLAVWNETWTHRFDPHTTVLLGTGLSGSRSFVPNDGTVVAWSVFPTFNAGVVENAPLARGILSLSLFVSSAPALDLTTLTVDPRVAVIATAGWARNKFFSTIAGGTAFSISDMQGSTNLQSASGAASMGYFLSKAVSLDTGVRGAWQSFGGATVFPFTYAAFVGMNFGAKLPLR